MSALHKGWWRAFDAVHHLTVRMRVAALTMAMVGALTGCGASAAPSRTSALPPSGSLPPSPATRVVTDYLNAVQTGDCASAERYTRPALFSHDGDLCVGSKEGPIRFDRWRSSPSIPPAHAAAGDYEFGVELHVTSFGPAAGGIGSLGWHVWFLEARSGHDGYRLVSGGSGP